MTPPPVDREMTRAEMAKRLTNNIGSAKLRGYVDLPITLEAAAAELLKTCEWKANEDGYWDTACQHAFVTEDGGSTIQHGFRFCCFCGGTLVEVPFMPEADDDDEA